MCAICNVGVRNFTNQLVLAALYDTHEHVTPSWLKLTKTLSYTNMKL